MTISPMFKMIVFCLSQTAIIHGFRMIAKQFTSVRTVTKLHMTSGSAADYSIPDQQARFAKAKKEGDKRMLDTDSFYNPSFLKGKSVLVTGGNRGLGLAITEELVKQGAKVIITSRAPATIEGVEVISGIEMQDNKSGEVLAKALKGQKIDILINNAGYFYEPVETLESLNFEEELKMIDICAVGPLRITAGLSTAGLLPSGSKVAIITSQGGSVEWRSTQNPDGQDYGHHMSKAAANMMGKLLSQEMKGKGVSVCMLHPGFNKTGMTKKYEKIWEIEGAVDPSIGAKRVIHEIGLLDLSRVGTFINCEDGKLIPW